VEWSRIAGESWGANRFKLIQANAIGSVSIKQFFATEKYVKMNVLD
jgi:hypothetical protein